MITRQIQMVGIASLLMLAACSSLVTFSSPTRIARTLPPGDPTRASAASNGLNAEPSASAVGALRAPLCQASQTCAALDAEQIPIACVKKVPYTNVLVPLGTTFEVQDPSGNFMCLDTGVVTNGKEVLTCHGKELYSFQLLLTNTACSGDTLTAGSGQCDEGYGYDSEQKCCAPVSNGSAGSTIVTVNLSACPLPNP